MILRTETPTDIEATTAMVDLSFGETTESLLIDLIRRSGRFVPDLSIIAEEAGAVVRHILFSYVTIERNEWCHFLRCCGKTPRNVARCQALFRFFRGTQRLC